MVAVGVLLPIDEVLGGLDSQRITQDRRAAMGRGAQPHFMRGYAHRTVELVAGLVMERNAYGHLILPLNLYNGFFNPGCSGEPGHVVAREESLKIAKALHIFDD